MTEPGDDPAGNDQIPDDTRLLRWVPESRLPIPGGPSDKPASDTWAPSTDGTGTSVYIEGPLVSASDVLNGPKATALVSITALEVRKLGLDVRRDPIDDGTHIGSAHAAIVGWPERRAERKKLQILMRDRSNWVEGAAWREPPGDGN